MSWQPSAEWGVRALVLAASMLLPLGMTSVSAAPPFALIIGEDEAPTTADPADEQSLQRQEQRIKHAYVIRLAGEITPSMRGFFERSLDSARRGAADVIVLDIDSGGGRLDTTLEMTATITSLEDIETVAFIRQEAYSGAAMLALACDRIEMHPEAQFGDVGVIVGGPFSPFQYVDEKQRSPVVSSIRTLAANRGRPAALAEAMVDMDVTVYSARHREDDRLDYFTEQEWESLANQDQWDKGMPVFESRAKKFLTVDGSRAVELGLAEGTSRSLDDVLGKLGADRPATVIAWTWIDTLVDILNSFWIAGLLILVGFIALFIELSAPGIGLGGLVSLLCFALFFWSRFLGGTAGWLEVTLFLVSLAFIGAELFVIPGFGVAGISGAILLVLSLVMSSQRMLMPQSGADWSYLGLNLLTVCGAMTGVVVALFFAADYLGTMPVFRKLMLEPPTFTSETGGPKSGKAAVPSVLERLTAGDLGAAVSPLRPSGKAQFGDDVVDVTTEGEFLASNTPIRVYRISPGKIIVREA